MGGHESVGILRPLHGHATCFAMNHLLTIPACILSLVYSVDGADLQALLDQGMDVLLEPGSVHEVKDTLRVTHAGQQIATRDAQHIEDFATLRLAPGAIGTLINAEGVPNITLERLILDGNRYAMRTADGNAPPQPLLSLGRQGGDRQTVRQCVILNARCAGGWGAIHFHENGQGGTIADNIIFGSGVDVLGNGRSGLEAPFGYADGISTSCPDSRVRNNLIIDATDEGIMVQGAPGTRVESNVIAAISREMLAGIALIDATQHYVIDAEQRRHDYRGVVVGDNLIDARGARIHIGVAMGALCWGDYGRGTTLVGARVEDNVVSGDAAAYGFAAAGIDAFMVRGNRSLARYSGIGDGLPHNPPDPPAAFLFDPDTVGTSDLQPDFQPARRHLVHLMRNWWQPSNPLGYRATTYGDAEAKATVTMAYRELLERMPTPDELGRWTDWLNASRANVDALRRALMTLEEFGEKHRPSDPLTLHAVRTRMWMERLALVERSLAPAAGGDWPSARTLYEDVLSSFEPGMLHR